jgi:hypothetical protein
MTPQWVTVAVAAVFLGVSPQNIIAMAVAKKIKRERRLVNHLAVKPSWMYSMNDLVRVLESRGGKPASWHTDASGKYITANDAARLLLCSVSAIYAYANNGRLATKDRVAFTWPRKYTAKGFSFADVMAMRAHQHTLSNATSFEEETVLEQTVILQQRDKYPAVTDPAQQEAIRRHIQALQEMIA